MLRERRFWTGTVEVNYAEGPANGPPLVLLHGGAASWRHGAGLLDLLADRWRLFAPDLRGHGRSGRVPGRYRLFDYAEDVAALLAGLVREPAVVYGHSLGAEVGIAVAARHPDRVRAVVHGDAPVSIVDHPTEEPTHRAMNVLWHGLAGRPVADIAVALRETPVSLPGQTQPVRAGDAFGDDAPWFASQALNLHRLDPGVLDAVLAGPADMLAGYDPKALLPTIACPVLLLQADPAHGGLLTDAEAARARALLPRAEQVRLDGIGHELHSRYPERVFAAISPFLADVRASSDPA